MLEPEDLAFEPKGPEQIGPASVELRLGNIFLTPRATNGILLTPGQRVTTGSRIHLDPEAQPIKH